MNTFLLVIGLIVLVSGGICLIVSDETVDYIISAVLLTFGIGFVIMSLNGSDKVYKLTITDTKTNEVTYEIVTEIEERESYLKYTDEDGNVHYILMEDKEILKEELE